MAFSYETNSYLVVRGEASLLFDCPSGEILQEIRRNGLPLPELIVHTQVEEENCRE